MDSSSKSWSIYGRKDITTKYKILQRIGWGAYSDVYKATRISDGLPVALKEIHDYQSAFREIEALQVLKNCPNVVVLHEYFWREDEDEDAVLVLEYLRTDLASVIKDGRRGINGGISIGEIKRWMVQILLGVDACHRNSIVHRDLKPSNFLVSDCGVLKLADFGQARILLEPGFVAEDMHHDELNATAQGQPSALQQSEGIVNETSERVCINQGQGIMSEEELLRDLVEQKAKATAMDDTDKESYAPDGDTSCLATCTTSELEDDPFKGLGTYEPDETGEVNYGPLTSCVGTRWYRAPELLYGSINYGVEIDLWSLGCIFAELFSSKPLFPGTSDIDQLGRIFNILGNLTEENFPGCSNLPDYKLISFSKIEKPTGLELCLPNRSPDEILILQKLLCFDPASRATAMELLQDKYLTEDPLPVPITELRVPLTKCDPDEDFPGNCQDYRETGSDSDFDEFAGINVTKTDTGFSVRFD